jgi:hypothetical protein
MTTLHEYRENQPDKLLESLEITLTPEQQAYLKANEKDLRTLLLKKFNLKFGTHYSKIQLTQAIGAMKEIKFKSSEPKEKKSQGSKSGIKNIYWVASKNRWMVQFKVGGKQKTLGHFKDFMQAKKVAAEYRKKLA